MTVRRAAAALAILVAWAPPRIADGQEADPEARVSDLVARAAAAHSAGEYRRCVTLYRSAWARIPRAELLFNIGVCQYDAGWDREALATFEAFLATDPPPATRARAERLASGLRAALRPEDQRPPGAPERRARADAVFLSERAFEPPEARWTPFHTGAAVTAGIGLASLVAATALAIDAADRWPEVQARCPALSGCDGDTIALAEAAGLHADVATAGFAVAGAAAVTALVLWLTAPADDPSVALVPTADGPRRAPLTLGPARVGDAPGVVLEGRF